MIELNDEFMILDARNCPESIEYIDFNLESTYNSTNPALKINFSDDIVYNTLCIKKLQNLENNNVKFCSQIDNNNVKYIISNCDQDILVALKAISISDTKSKYEYLYNSIFESLDIIWNANNPCKFCNNICIATSHNKRRQRENGCCYSFTYSKKPFKFIENEHLCEYLSENKKCTTQNISCKLFVCPYLKKAKLFNIDIKNFLLIQAFFNRKQQLILKYNYFKSKEEIINKLLEKNNNSLLLYYLLSKYRIDR